MEIHAKIFERKTQGMIVVSLDCGDSHIQSVLKSSRFL